MANLLNTNINGELSISNKALPDFILDNLFIDPLSHNGFFRGKNLTNLYSWDELHNKIVDEDFSDIFIGDYFIINDFPDLTQTTHNIVWRIAGINIFKGTGTGNIKFDSPHIVLFPDTTLDNSYYWGTSNTDISSGFAGSVIYTEYIPFLSAYLPDYFGNYLLEFPMLISTAVDTTSLCPSFHDSYGIVIDNNIVMTKIGIPDEQQIVGCNIWTTSGIDISPMSGQFPLFMLAPQYRWCKLSDGITNGIYWLKTICCAKWAGGSTPKIAGVSYLGNIGAFSPRDIMNIGVRPYVLFG